MKDHDPPHAAASVGGWGLFALVGVLLCFGALNIAVRATWHELEDGVLVGGAPGRVAAADVAAAARRWRPASGRAICSSPLTARPWRRVEDVSSARSGATRSDTRCSTPCLRLGQQQMLNVEVAPIPAGNPTLYFILAAIGIFTLLVGAAVRLRRPHDPATLHFFWLCRRVLRHAHVLVQRRLDRLDWFSTGPTSSRSLLLPPLFLHFTLVFPERPRLVGPRRRQAAGRRCSTCPPRPAGLAIVIAVGRLPLNTAAVSSRR